MAWTKPSEELPEHLGRRILFVVPSQIVCSRGVLMFCGGYDDEMFCYGGHDYRESEVLAWCYAPALPDWVEEE